MPLLGHTWGIGGRLGGSGYGCGGGGCGIGDGNGFGPGGMGSGSGSGFGVVAHPIHFMISMNISPLFGKIVLLTGQLLHRTVERGYWKLGRPLVCQTVRYYVSRLAETRRTVRTSMMILSMSAARQVAAYSEDHTKHKVANHDRSFALHYTVSTLSGFLVLFPLHLASVGIMYSSRRP
jgi:hypothetical protein